jgi:hypothetical protein
MSYNNQGQYIPQLSYGPPAPEPAGAQPVQQSNSSNIIIGFLLLAAVGLAVALGYIYVKKTNCPDEKKCPEPKTCPTCPICPTAAASTGSGSTAAAPAALTTMQQDNNYDRVVKQFQATGSFIVGGDDSLQNTAIVIIGEFMKANNITGYSMFSHPSNYYAIMTSTSKDVAISLIRALFPKH